MIMSYNIIVEIQYIEANNCFLHLSPNIYSKLSSFLSCCVKGHVVKNQQVIYLSTNPDVCHKLSDSVVGLSPVYAAALSLSPGDKIILIPIDSAPSLNKITTRPLSDDDRQILEISSAEVEASLLNQLRIVWANQCFPIWISPSITVKLVVDDIFPDVEFGKLEEMTELVIGDAKEPNKLINKSTETLSAKPANNEQSESMRGERVESLVESLVCRLVPEPDYLEPPYQVKLSPLCCPDWLKSADDELVFKLLSCSDQLASVYVNVKMDTCQSCDIGPHKTLCASSAVFNHLSLSTGCKSLLLPITSHPNEVSSLLITPCLLLKKKYLPNEIENIFLKKISSVCLKWGRCLLNTKGLFPLDSHTYVIVTLRPLNLEWANITLLSLYNLPISVNTYENYSVSGLVENKDIQLRNDHPCSFVGSIFPEVNLLAEHSFGLKLGLRKRISFANNFLLIGKHGSGKSHISDYFLRIISTFPFYIHFEMIDCTSLKGKRIESITKIFISHLNLCKSKQPSILLIEHIDIICGTFSPELEKTEVSFHTQRVSKKIADILESFFIESSLLIFATTTSATSVNSSLFKRRGKSIFSTVLPIQTLTQVERKKLIETIILNKTLNEKDSFKKLNLDYYSSLTDSYVAGDLFKFIEKAIFEASQRSTMSSNKQPVLTEEDLEKAFKSCSAFINHKLKVQKSQDVKLSDVGGLKDVKEKLIEVILWPSKFASLMNQCPLRKQTGVLLYGAPGSGKTLIARAIAQASNLNFITVKGPELMSKYIGESEEGVRRVFENAQVAKPSLLFFDEFESLAPRRGEEQTGVTDRVVNQLLTALDGVEPISGVIVVAASSRPDLIDPALLRAGRLSHHLFCTYPNVEDRLEILEKLTSPINLDKDVDLKVISELTGNFSGADLKGLLMTAQIQVLDKLVDSKTMNESKGISEETKSEVRLTQADLLEALNQTQPSLSRKEKHHFASIYKVFACGKVPDVTKQRAIFA